MEKQTLQYQIMSLRLEMRF
jgi:hypothetical protein